MEMYQVRYFLALADALNFTRAAEQCAVTQPALTRAIKLLEEELGGLLFHRERANTQLTELGRMVRPHLEHVYGKTQETKRLAKDFAQGKNTKLKLGIMCTIAPDQIVELIDGVRTRHPSIELQLCDANAWDLQKQLLEGALEIAIYCLPGREPEARTHVMPLFRERIVIAINPRHRLANLDAIRVKDLDGEVLYPPDELRIRWICRSHFCGAERQLQSGLLERTRRLDACDGRCWHWLGLYAGALGEASGGFEYPGDRTGVLARGQSGLGPRPRLRAACGRPGARGDAHQLVRRKGVGRQPCRSGVSTGGSRQRSFSHALSRSPKITAPVTMAATIT